MNTKYSIFSPETEEMNIRKTIKQKMSVLPSSAGILGEEHLHVADNTNVLLFAIGEKDVNELVLMEISEDDEEPASQTFLAK